MALLAGSYLRRRNENLIDTLNRLGIDPKTVSPEVAAAMTKEKPIPSRRYLTEPTTKLHVSDCDPGLSFSPKYSDEQWARFQRTAFEKYFRKPVIDPIERDDHSMSFEDWESDEESESLEEIGSGFSIVHLREVNTRREESARPEPWWMGDNAIFDRLCDHWVNSAKNARGRAEAELSRRVLIEWYTLGWSDQRILAEHAEAFKSIQHARKKPKTADSLRVFRHRLLAKAAEFFDDDLDHTEPGETKHDPTFQDRRLRRERWRSIREGKDAFRHEKA